MRTKTLLLAVAALAAGVISSEAQNVYSQNIVGYANVVLVGGGGFTLVANPFDDGNGNQLTNLLATLPNKSTVTTWNGVGYNAAIVKGASGWGANVSLPPGTGFFVKNGIASSPAVTNTFVGNVIVNVGSSLTNAVATGFNLVGSPIPYAADATTDTNIDLGPVLPNKSQLISWNSGSQLFNAADVKGASGFGSAFPITVGEGFFVKAQSGTNWAQTLYPTP